MPHEPLLDFTESTFHNEETPFFPFPDNTCKSFLSPVFFRTGLVQYSESFLGHQHVFLIGFASYFSIPPPPGPRFFVYRSFNSEPVIVICSLRTRDRSSNFGIPLSHPPSLMLNVSSVRCTAPHFPPCQRKFVLFGAPLFFRNTQLFPYFRPQLSLQSLPLRADERFISPQGTPPIAFVFHPSP